MKCPKCGWPKQLYDAYKARTGKDMLLVIGYTVTHCPDCDTELVDVMEE